MTAEGYKIVEPTDAEAFVNNVNALKAAKIDNDAEIARLKVELATKTSRVTELENAVANQSTPQAQQGGGQPAERFAVVNGVKIDANEVASYFSPSKKD